ncbi:NADP-dependent oxidoreductase [Algihabitans albus]|uniref:NADP-dependent oxidoreductase n=1 Tax=Algihabitans albus TaxID=2164067 RepID=UPI000E5D9CB9|nr:NADP-dependent oxidoreductase [Algihabitans albus]
MCSPGVRVPKGVAPDCFRLEEAPAPAAGAGQVLIRVLWLSCDPAMRGWIAEGPNYSEPVPLGGVMRSFTLGRVEASDHPDYPVGVYVLGRQGWQNWAISDGSDIDRIVDPEQGPLSANLHLFGMTGLTAYLGLSDVGRPKPGETVVVSTAAGAVGALVGQIAGILGCRTVGITGSPEKVADCLDRYGYDAALNYKDYETAEALADACPAGVDIYYDMTAGWISDAVMGQINLGARVVLVGTMALPSGPPPVGPRYSRQMLVKRATMTGFLVLDHFDRLEEAVTALAAWYREGRLQYREDVTEGLERAPLALMTLLDGSNRGKVLVKLAE